VHEQLRDVAAVRRVRLRRVGDLHGPDDGSVGEGREQDPPAALDIARHGLERRARVCL
jgi:hypothetical protein